MDPSAEEVCRLAIDPSIDCGLDFIFVLKPLPAEMGATNASTSLVLDENYGGPSIYTRRDS
jgi:hypothetical protein